MSVDEPRARASAPALRPTMRVIRSLTPSLMPSEARVAGALLEAETAPEEWSVTELAAAAGTSSATVVRACRSLGFTGFTQLRDAVVRETRAAAPTADARPEDAARRTIEAARSQLDSMAAMFDARTFERAVDLLADAPRVLVVTMSDLAVLGHYAVFRFATIGRPVEAPVDAITLNAVAAQLSPRDVCLAIGHSGTNGLTFRIASAAATAGATVVAVTSFARCPLAEAAQLHLTVGSADAQDPVHDMSRTRVAQMVMIDALQNAVAQRRETGEATSATFRALSQYAHRRTSS